MRICCILHADFELPGYFETWSNKNDYLFFQFCPYLGEKLPDYNSFDILLVMGGPQSACDTENYPYLLLEMELIKTAAAKNKFVLGVCLGAQLISESFGFKTQESPEKEFGVFSLTKTAEGKKAAILDGLPNKFLSGHWHNDMPGLPDGASVLIESEGCPRQLIRYTPRIYGFQCHLEFNRASVERLIECCADDLTSGKYVQCPKAMVSHNFDEINQHLDVFLNRLFLF